MRGISRFILASKIAVLAIAVSSTAVLAQSAGTDEAIRGNNPVAQNLTLTVAQRHAIFNAVFQQPSKPYSNQLTTAVGAPVPETAELIDLPEEAMLGASATGLKYALAVNDVIVVVDPLQMRVVDVLHANAKH